MTDVGMSRRGALGALAAFTAAPAIALPAPVDAANALWAERQKHVERLAHLSKQYNAAHDKLPAWAMSGPERLDASGNFCGNDVNWPLVEDLAPPSMGERIVRPSIYQAKENFEFAVRVFGSGSTPAFRERCRANMRRNIRAIVVRLRERNHIYAELGLDRIDREMSDACTAMCEAEDAIGELTPTPNAVAAIVLAGVCNDCSRSDFAEGNGYCGTMAMALVALRGVLPGLSGLIREHAAFFAGNPTLPLSAMPFAPV
jgi:hypothetical protein